MAKRKSKSDEQHENEMKNIGIPQKRENIHPVEKENKDQVALQCSGCKAHFLVEDEFERKLNNTELEEWKEIMHRKSVIYPSLEKEAPFTCNACIGAVIPESMAEKVAAGPSKDIANQKCTVMCGIAICMVVLAVLALKFGSMFRYKKEMPSIPILNETLSVAEEELENKLYELEDVYTHQEEMMWVTLTAGIKSVMKEDPHQPSVFLVLYDSDSAEMTARCIIRDVTKIATRFMMNTVKEPLIINGKQLKSNELENDPGLLLVRYNSTVREKGAMVVNNLQDVPPLVATSFHFFCDRYSPLVRKAIYFFTLNVQKFLDKPAKTAGYRLKELWSTDLPDNKYQPLITRMTSNVVRVFSDNVAC